MGPGGPLSSPSRETFTTKGVERLIFARYLLQHPHAGRCPAPCTRWVETVTTPCAWLHRIAAVRAQDKKGVEQVVEASVSVQVQTAFARVVVLHAEFFIT